MTARATTGADLVRALRGLSRQPAVRAAVRERAETLAVAIEEIGGEGVAVTVAERSAGDVIVTASGPGLFAREFGSLAAPAEPVVAPAVERMRR